MHTHTQRLIICSRFQISSNQRTDCVHSTALCSGFEDTGLVLQAMIGMSHEILSHVYQRRRKVRWALLSVYFIRTTGIEEGECTLCWVGVFPSFPAQLCNSAASWKVVDSVKGTVRAAVSLLFSLQLWQINWPEMTILASKQWKFDFLSLTEVYCRQRSNFVLVDDFPKGLGIVWTASH